MKDFNPELRCMLAHKVDGDHPSSCSELLLAARKLERQNEARDLLSKTTPSGQSNITHSQTSVNLFPSQKLKGNQTFTVHSAAVVGNEGGEDMDAKPEQEEEVGSSVEDPVTFSDLGGSQSTDQLHCPFCQCCGAVPEENQKFFGVWQS